MQLVFIGKVYKNVFIDNYTLQGYSISIKEKEVNHLDKFLHDHPSKPRTQDEKQKVVNRLKRIEGQVRGIQKMVEDDRYCMDILVQISAIQSALKNVGFAVTERHINHCVSDAIKQGEGKETIEELMGVLKQFSK
jgi:CsoR family transcriptional regulator, copper-sensing transcriptional repressor